MPLYYFYRAFLDFIRSILLCLFDQDVFVILGIQTNLFKINKVKAGHPHIVDMIKNNEVHLIINTTEGARSIKDSFSIRKEAQNHKISLTTTVSGAKAFCKAIKFIDDFGAQDLKQRHESIL